MQTSHSSHVSYLFYLAAQPTTVNLDTEKEMQLRRWLGLDIEMVDQDSQ